MTLSIIHVTLCCRTAHSLRAAPFAHDVRLSYVRTQINLCPAAWQTLSHVSFFAQFFQTAASLFVLGAPGSLSDIGKFSGF